MARFASALTILLVLSSATPLFAQRARATGTVREIGGEPIKGATVTAINAEATPSELVSTTDDRGRWGMIGLNSGTWTFIVEAPGFRPEQGTADVRVAETSPLNVTLARDPGPAPGSLDRTILLQVTRANDLRDQGAYAEAITSYVEILKRNPKLTSLNLVVAGIYRQQATAAADSAARQQLLDRAIAMYTDLLEDEAVGARARAELEAARAEAAGARQ